MSDRARGVALALFQVALLLLVWGRYAVDRATLPMAWVRTVPIDPDDPLRGRYVRLWLEARDESSGAPRVELAVRGDTLVARAASEGAGLAWRSAASADPGHIVLDQPVAYFLPEGVPDPSRLEAGEELWVQVSVPRDGLPRPLQLERRHP